MAKTQEELKQLKKEYETLNGKLKELTDDELKEVIGGNGNVIVPTIDAPLSPFGDNPLPNLSSNKCSCDYALDDFGNRYFRCTDKANQGKKAECVNCKARYSTK